MEKLTPSAAVPITPFKCQQCGEDMPSKADRCPHCGQVSKRIRVHQVLRALVKHLDGVADADIVELNIPTGIPLVYELEEDLKPIRHDYLGDTIRVKKAMQAVASQASLSRRAP